MAPCLLVRRRIDGCSFISPKRPPWYNAYKWNDLAGVVLTSIIAIVVSYGIYLLLPAGNEALRSAVDSSVNIETMKTAGSAKEMILEILPESFLRPFLNQDMIQLLFIAKVYGISPSGEILFILFPAIFILSVAAPAVPGGLLLCLTVLLPMLGIPIEGVSLLIGLYFPVAMIDTMTNVVSTASVSYVVDKLVKD